jgi:hypothetical protein
MIKRSTRELYIEYFRTQELLRYVVDILPLTLMGYKSKRETDIAIKPLIDSIRNQAKNIGLVEKTFEHFLGITLDGLLKGNSPKALTNYVRSHAEMIHRKICAVPNSLEKAYDALRALVEVDDWKADQEYDAFVLLSDELPKTIISREINKWKRDAKQYETEGGHAIHLSSIFWNSLDFHEDIDGVSRYRFREHFNFGEFETAFAEIESMFEANIAPAVAGISEMRDIHGSSELQIVSYELWLASRSAKLCNRIQDSISLALENISALQSPEGWWADTNVLIESNEGDLTKRPRYLSSTYITTLCTLDLLKLSVKDSQIESGVLGARWLLSKQNADGSWSREKITKDGIIYKSEIFVTILALEALIRSGISNIGHTVDLGIQWLLNQQEEFGTWNDEGFPFPFMTVAVLELLKLKDSHPLVLDHYQSVSRGFILRSKRLVLEDNANSRRLAVIASYHGLEAFLYSLLNHPSINIPVFNRKGDKTIGMKEALDQFQTYLQQRKIIKATEAVLCRNSLDRLAYLRDQIVHKAIDVTESECSDLINDAQGFIEKYSHQIFNFNVLS